MNVLVQVSWNVPYDNSAEVNGYKVYVADSTGTFRLESTYCNGLIEPVKTQRLCQMPMSYLRSAYGLTFGTLIQAKVQASN